MKWTAAVLAGIAAYTGITAQANAQYLTFDGRYPVQRLLFYNQMIESSNCGFRTIYQTDGNLVTYNASNHAIWASNTSANQVPAYPPPGEAAMQLDGNFVLYDVGDNPVWATNTYNQSLYGYLIQQDDGNLVLYNYLGQVMWASNPPNVAVFSGTCHVARHTDVAWGYDEPGGDYSSFYVINHVSACGNRCASDPNRCKAFTFVPPNYPGITGSQAKCFLKSSYHQMVGARGMVSGDVVIGGS